MKLRILERSLKNLILWGETAFNRRRGREFIPTSKDIFCIETSSACNLKCRFCAYEKKLTPRTHMSHDLFIRCVEQALDLGYQEFHLTPCTGDVFMDPHVFEKFAYLDAHDGVRRYHFFTNLTVLDAAKIERLLKLKKLSRMTISLYGHDEASFVALTKSPARIYRRLLGNMETLLARQSEWPFSVGIGFRSTFDVPRDDSASELLDLIRRYRDAGVGVHSSHGIYNNWGGQITQADVAGLNLHITSAKGVYKSGACVKLFDSFQVTASGLVNGCSCRDADSTLRIGDLNEAPLRSILSDANLAYMALISEQQAGKFRTVCSSCDYYRSIYHQPSNFRRDRIPTQTMAGFFDRLRAATKAPSARSRRATMDRQPPETP